MKESSNRVSLGDIARAAGVSRVTVCYVMRNRPGPSRVTRERILQLAQKMGYVPDPRIASWMATVREVKKKELFPIAWLSTDWESDAWEKHRYLSPYLTGAQARAEQLGYRLENIWAYQESIPMRRISQIIYQRGIEGVIITHPARHFRLNWEHVAAVSIEGSLLAPPLHRVMTDTFFNLLLAMKMVRRFGYRRIGICLAQTVDRESFHAIRAAAHHFHATTPKGEKVTPLFYPWERPFHPSQVEDIFKQWIRRERPDVVVGHSADLIGWAQSAGFRVPQDVGIIHIGTDDDVADWAGICSHRAKIGAAAVEWVISLLQNRQFGVPETALRTMVRGTWRDGWTLLTPKPK